MPEGSQAPFGSLGPMFGLHAEEWLREPRSAVSSSSAAAQMA